MIDRFELGELYTTSYFNMNRNNIYLLVEIEDLEIVKQFVFYNTNTNKKVKQLVVNEKGFKECFTKI